MDGKKDAFAMMRAAQQGKKQAAASSSSSAAPEPSTSSATAPPPAPVFKGSGLGAGPRHFVDPANQPWVEKYRPKNLEQVSAQDHTVQVLKKTLGSSNLPHMLFYGPPGTGKTSTILALCKQMFGPELYRSRVLELNASDERGISVVRDKIKNFAKTTVTTNHDAAPAFKIIILDEADSMTQDAQSALRRIMETYSKITRFCLICNYVTRIIEPITSRCSKFRFKPLDTSSTEARLRDICVAENVNCPDDALQALIRTSDGDLRRAITYLQSASRLASATGEPISPEGVQEIGGVVPDWVLRELGRALGVRAGEDEDGEDGDVEMKSARGSPFDRVRAAVEKVSREGYSAVQVLSQLHDLLILDPLVPARAKASIALDLGLADKALTDGADEELQLLNCCARIERAVRGV
ncbi:replication factor C subunit 2/4 [Rhodotorula diobovata]|uniref:Replication factor C subunit 2 n=1 Tax=Rhodotorula diobovata TaxID=5288 RepID=A0A5C5FVG6_9BASI|nr:replication factor C subunit 2/4 [Rhodotorula diobovata]